MDDKFIRMSERIAALEEQAKQGQVDRDELKVMLVAALTRLTHTDQNLNGLINKISKWEGKFGGVIFVVSCVWVFLTGIPGAIMEWVKLGGGK